MPIEDLRLECEPTVPEMRGSRGTPPTEIGRCCTNMCKIFQRRSTLQTTGKTDDDESENDIGKMRYINYNNLHENLPCC